MIMKNNILYPILGMVLVICLLSLFQYPEIMISPGKLMQGHQELSNRCMACHVFIVGTTSEKCMVCHRIDEIGIVTTKGKAIEQGLEFMISFHRELVEKDCVACHSDHVGVSVYRKISTFTHGLLAARIRDDCKGCHKKPDDKLHKKITDNCSRCHNDHEWETRILDHDDYFVLDEEHDVECSTCHTKDDYALYSCYGCHEHRYSSIRDEHIEEGINDFTNCTECHLSADEDDIRHGADTSPIRDRDRRHSHDEDHEEHDEDDEDDEDGEDGD